MLTPRGQSYLPALDGIRALAVLAVIVYHARPDWLPGGFLGVDVFFAISGFIITRTLLTEWRQQGRINIKRFYLRRARRLMPALALVIIAVLAYALVAHPGQVASLRLDAIAAGLQVANWRFIIANQTYFEAFARPSALRHLWSLAVEEQFYIFWPLVVAAGLKLMSPKLLASHVWLLAVISTAWMSFLYSQGASASRLYYGTDTRVAALLVGATLSLVWSGKPLRVAPWWREALIDLVGLVSLAGIAAAVYFLDDSKALLYKGGFGLIALASSFLIYAAVNQVGVVSRLFSLRPLRWIGQRSYGIYLWHWPLALLTWPRVPTPLQMLAEILAAVTLAAISYQVVERPVRDGGLTKLLGGMRGRITMQPLQRAGLIFTSVGALSMVIWLGVLVIEAKKAEVPPYLAAGHIRLVNTPPALLPGNPVLPAAVPPSIENVAPPAEPPVAQPVVPAAIAPTDDIPLQASKANDVPSSTSNSISSAGSASDSTNPVPAPPPGSIAEPAVLPPAPAEVYLAASSPPVTAVGDSVMLGAVNELAARIPYVDVDAQVGRQASQTARLLYDRLQDGSLGEVIVINIGNNGTFTDAQFDQIMAVVGPARKVVFVNNKVPRRWEDGNNIVIANGVARYPNAVLVDWHSEGDARPDFFYDDAVHLRPSGAAAFANMVAAAIVKG